MVEGIRTPLECGDVVNRAETSLMAGQITGSDFVGVASAMGLAAAAASAIGAHGESVAQTQATLKNNLSRKYDYIVCGSGSSGSVVARRLSDNPDRNVLLLEAGQSDSSDKILDPKVWFTNPGTSLSWDFWTAPQSGLNGRSISSAMGKAFGGGSSINAMAYVRGHKNDYNYWADQAGDAAWDYEHVLSIYKSIEDFHGPGDPKFRGTGGVVWSQIAKDPNPVAPAMVASADAIGIRAFDDHNGVMMEGDGGVAISNHAIKDGRRRNMPSHYLHPVMNRKNLTVLLGAEVTGITLEGRRAKAVRFNMAGQPYEIEAAHEIILSLGAINTPKILMLSGIGDAAHLKAVDIPVKHHLPGVGKNFHDHILLGGCVWEYKTPEPIKNNAAECTFFWKSDSSLDSPDLQPYQIEVPFVSEVTSEQFQIPEHCWSIGVGLDQPKSRGSVTLASNNPTDFPIVDPNFLAEEADMRALLRGVELCREIGNGRALQDYVRKEVMPGKLANDELRDFVRNSALTYWHQVGSCKMGNDEMSVVDAQLRVYGIDGLRVADASIMPRITTGNTMCPSMIIGERLGQILS